jgi:hypothetical protein
MAAPDVLQFGVFAGNGKGLLARPIIQNNHIAVKGDIESIDFSIYDTGTEDAPVTGTLDPNIVMFTAPQTWDKDTKGYTLFIDAPGSWWPLPNKNYRVVIALTATSGMGGATYLIVWEAQTADPSGRANPPS